MGSITKRLALIVMFVTYSFNIVSAQQSYTKFLQENSQGLKHVADFINSANQNLHQTPHHKLVRRQTTESDESTFTPEDEAFCQAQLGAVLCSTGTRQGLIDAELRCGRDRGIKQAQIDANACARNERGQYCSSALSLFELGGVRRSDIIRNCSGVLTSNSCPTACRTQLENFRSTLGCCFNAYVNGSLTRRTSYRTILDYRLWNLCNVPLPTESCGNGPIVNRPANVRECTEEEYFNQQYIQNFCLPQRGQSYINAIVLSSRCNQSFHSLAELLVDVCSEDADGSPCGFIMSDIINDLNSDCATSNVGCTSNCSDSINDAKDMYDCCLNSVWFNTSTDSPPGLSYSVWKSCEIQTPGFCESSLSLRGTAASIMKDSHVAIFLIMTIAGLVCHYMQDTIKYII
jgi:hypothetical protein